jgi:hypothetical protein
MDLAFKGGQGHGVSPARDVSKFSFPSPPELTAPRFESREELRAPASGLSWEDAMKRVLLILSLLLPISMLTSVVASAETKLAASLFSYDGADFVRTQTTLTQDGQSAVNTKLDHDSAAYKALSQKHSYSGPATIMGQAYEAHYAPIVGADGKLTGALFVGVPK